MVNDILNDEVNGGFDEDDFPPGSVVDETEIEPLFETCFDMKPMSDFLLDVYEFWEKNGFVTAAQYEKLQEIADGE